MKDLVREFKEEYGENIGQSRRIVEENRREIGYLL